MTLSDATWTLHGGTQIGDVFPVKSLKPVQEMLWMDPQLSDWDSSDEVLLEMYMTGTDSSRDEDRSARALWFSILQYSGFIFRVLASTDGSK